MGSVIKTAFPTFNGYAPKEGVKALPIFFDFRTVAVLEFDLLLENTQGSIQMVQSVWVDNADNPNSIEILFGVTNQRVVVPANVQAMCPVITVDQTRVKITGTINPDAVGQIILMNVPMPYTQVGAVTVNVPAINVAAITPVTATDHSGTITAGGTSQSAIPANTSRLGFTVQNPTNEIEPLYINFTSAAGAGNSIEILPGQIFPPNGSPYVSTEEITINAATTGHVYIAKEYQ